MSRRRAEIARIEPGHLRHDVFFRGEHIVDTTWECVTASGRCTLRLQCPEPLDVTDLDVLLAVLHLVSEDPRRLECGASAVNPLGRLLSDDLLETLRVRTTFYRLCVLLRRTRCRSAYLAIQDSLNRLAKTTVTIHRPELHCVCHLLAFTSQPRHLDIAVYPVLAEVAIGHQGLPWVAIDLDAYVQLSTTARLLHAKLLSQVFARRHRKFHWDTLAALVWPRPASPQTQAWRRREVRQAVRALAELPTWSIEHKDSGAVIRRARNV